MSIETEITKLQSAKENMRTVLSTKLGSNVASSVSITSYHNLISSAAVIQYNLGSAAGAASGGGGGGGGDPIVMGGGIVTPVSTYVSSNTSMGQIDLQYVSLCNISISGGTSMSVRSNSVVSNINVMKGIVTSSYGYTASGYGLINVYRGGLDLQAGCSGYGITVQSDAAVYISSGCYVSGMNVSAGGVVSITSATVSNIDLATGGTVYVIGGGGGGGMMDMSSTIVTDDYSSNGSVLTFVTAPRVTVKYVGESDGFFTVSGITTPSGANGLYATYSGSAGTYKHTESNYYIYFNTYYNYYLLGSVISATGYPSGQYFQNTTGKVFTGTWSAVSSGAGTMTATETSIGVAAGKWKLDNAATYYGFGSTVSTGDARDSFPTRTVTLSSVAGYVTPSAYTITSMPNRNTTIEMAYLISYTVTITGVSGGKWSYDGGTTWVNSGTSANIPANTYVKITFNVVNSGGTDYTHADMYVYPASGSTSTSVAYEEKQTGYLVTGAGTTGINGTYTLYSGTEGTTSAIYRHVNNTYDIRYFTNGWYFVDAGATNYGNAYYRNTSTDITAAYSNYMMGQVGNPTVTPA